MTEPTQAAFVNACKAATDLLWKHRGAMHSGRVRIGFWPQGMVIDAIVPARNNAQLQANGSPRVILWDDLATLTEGRLIEIVDEVCASAYRVLGIRAA